MTFRFVPPLVCAAAVCAGAPAEAQSLSLADAVRRALASDQRVRAAQHGLAAAQAERRSARGHFGPTLSIEANVQIWNSAFDQAFIDTGALPAGLPPELSEPFRIREQVTGQINLLATQPLAMQIIKGYTASKLSQQVARLDKKKAQRDVALQAAQAYIQLKQARAALEIAEAAVKQVDAQLKQGRSFFRAGVIGKNDLLKLELGLAQAQAARIRARSGVSLARTALALVVGLPPDAKVDASDRFADPPPPFQRGYADCLRQALARRAERRIARKRVAQAGAARDIAFWNLGPELALVANFQNVQGQAFLPKNQFFFGGVLKWNFWQWGSGYYSYKASKAKVEQARQGLSLLARAITIEVKQAYLQLGVARKLLEVERKRIKQAEEAYRIEQVKYSKQAATTRDVLDAQLAVTRAHLRKTNALYGFYLARAKLRAALGEMPGLGGKR